MLFLVGTETFLVSPLLPAISSNLGVSEVSAASIVTSYVLVYAVLAPVLAVVSDRHDKLRSVAAGAALFATANAICAMSGHLLPLMLGRGLAGLGAAIAGPAVWAHIAETAPERYRGRLIGFGMASFSCGQIIGVPIGGFIAGALSWHAAFASIGVLALVPIYLIVRRIRSSPSPRTAPRSGGAHLPRLFAVWRNDVVRRALLMTLALQTANLGCYAFLGSFLRHRFLMSQTALGLVGVTVGAGSFLGSILAGRLRDLARARGQRDGPRIAFWCLVLGASVVLAVNTTTLWLSMTGVTAWFLASGAFVTELQTLVSGAVPTMRASASSWSTTTMHVGTALGVWLVGASRDWQQGMTTVAASLGLLATVLALELWVHERRTSPAVAGDRHDGRTAEATPEPSIGERVRRS